MSARGAEPDHGHLAVGADQYRVGGEAAVLDASLMRQRQGLEDLPACVQRLVERQRRIEVASGNLVAGRLGSEEEVSSLASPTMSRGNTRMDQLCCSFGFAVEERDFSLFQLLGRPGVDQEIGLIGATPAWYTPLTSSKGARIS
jgi:hypothetical protein